MSREHEFIDDCYKEYQDIEHWHQQLLIYLSARRDPVLLQLKQTFSDLAAGQEAVKEVMHVFDDLVSRYEHLRDRSLKSSIYKRPLKKQPGNHPSIPYASQGDPSVLAFCALSQHLYDSNEDYDKLANSLSQIHRQLKPLVVPFDLKPMFVIVKQCEEEQQNADKLLNEYKVTVDTYLSHKSNLEHLIDKSRDDIFESRNNYVKAMLTLWSKHMHFIAEAQIQIKALQDRDHQRQQTMHLQLAQASDLFLQYHQTQCNKLELLIQKQRQAPDQAIEWHKQRVHHEQQIIQQPAKIQPVRNGAVDTYIMVNPSIPETEPALSASNNARYFGSIPPDNTVEELQERAQSLPAPGPFPKDRTVINSGQVVRNGFFTKKQCELIYTSSHKIHLFSEKGRDESEFDKYVKTYKDPEWVMDGCVAIARVYEKDPCIMIIKENHSSFFSINHENKVVFGSPSDCKTWVDFINNHNRFQFAFQSSEPASTEEPKTE